MATKIERKYLMALVLYIVIKLSWLTSFTIIELASSNACWFSNDSLANVPENETSVKQPPSADSDFVQLTFSVYFKTLRTQER